MLKGLFKYYIYPVAVMSGSIIGVGFLSLPYITMKAGIWVMLFYFVVLTTLVVYLHVIFAGISLRTPDFKRFPGFVGFYLGSRAKAAALLLMNVGSFGILLVYLIVAGQFLATIFYPVLGGNLTAYVLVFFAATGAVLYFDIKVIAKIEFWALSILAVLFAIIFIKSFPYIKLENIFTSNFLPTGQAGKFQISNLFLPYGAILFSLWGTGLIPEIEEMVRGHKKLLKKIIIIATLIPAALYALFVFLVLGVSGNQTTEFALTGLGAFINHGTITVALCMGVAAIFMAFVSQGLILKKSFMYDMGIKEFPAWTLTCFIPLALFLLGFNSFIPLISFVGGVFLGINGIFILLMYKKIGGKVTIIYPLMGIFLLGIAYELFYFKL
ncbi:MAG TPA: aromatic amino acid transport family protein [Negativicutes bacterium]|uniref:Amino acid transporter transmembrane domain-containing protein n=1 Tax=Candidatus Staskawiczbacteria bacterium RIFCSPHIGHO2_01_FULL_41_41 TaxID=1802203 RepID=A0A1G2HUS9_9BACT|nr:MAG: hypothetical protein A2822_02260 [Candidatus Staskawiczbacteria bacterium RIFCSPHIGHO2_01_FULL_41_41]OGZ74424.1 MAG: hypothetical protein A3A12_01490 [Candidatus Staskawiczbacteria bacterium RIFCSPLOWO2_01_FULL_43_17b]HLD70709.1 aromatic amino acid transport family protein [Negativicutes bacterium]